MDMSFHFLRRVLTAVFLAVSLAAPFTSSLHAQGPGMVDPVFGGAGLELLGTVQAVAVQPDGKILVAGGNNGIARLNADGTTDTSFHANIDPVGGVISVSSVSTQADGKIIIGGGFTQIAGIPHAGLARLNPDGSLDDTFKANVVGGVYATVLQVDGRVLLVGGFTQVDGVAREFVARVNTDGSLDTGFNASVTGFNDVLKAIVQPDGKILLVGDDIPPIALPTPHTALTDHTILPAAASTRTAVVRVNADGSPDASFNATVDEVYAIARQADGKILITGAFTQVNGTTCPGGAARLNLDGSLDNSFHASSFPGLVFAVQTDGKILCYYSGLTRLNADGSPDTSFDFSVNNYVNAVALQADGSLVVGGVFSRVDGVPRNSLARINPNGSLDTRFVPDVASGPNAPVLCLAVQTDGKVLLGGEFSQVDSATRTRVARLNADGSLDSTFNFNLGNDEASTGAIVALAVQSNGKIVVGGNFLKLGGATHQYLARLNADGSLDSTFNASADMPVQTLLVQADDKILLTGAFTMINNTFARGLARLKADGSFDATYDSSPSGNLAVQRDGKILLYDSSEYYCLTRLNADLTLDTAFKLSFQGNVDALFVQTDGKIIVGGNFNHITLYDGSFYLKNFNSLVRLNADGSLDGNFNPDVEGTVLSVTEASDGSMTLRGGFTTVNGAVRNQVARLQNDGSLDGFFNLDSGDNGQINTLALQTDGKILLGGNFTAIDGVLRNNVARLKANDAPDFFNGTHSVGAGFYYLQFPNGNVFGYYNAANFPIMYHVDMGFECFIDAGDGHAGAYLYDFTSNTFWYTSPTFPFPYLYDFSLNAFLYYYPDPNNAGHYNTNGVRYFFNFATGKIITK